MNLVHFLKEKQVYEFIFLGLHFQEFVPWSQLFLDFREAVRGDSKW